LAHFSSTVASDHSPEDVFDYLVDMRNAPAWDPGVLGAEILRPAQFGEAQVGEGTQFSVTLKLAGRPRVVTYEVHGYDRPRRVVLRAEEPSFRSTDAVSVTPAEGGSVVTYDATLSATGPWRLLAPVFALAFGRIGRRAEQGLRRELGR
jgi:uncharacterized protein YndB with AHSA1/START domain